MSIFTYEIIKEISKKFNLQRGEEGMLDDLWEVYQCGAKYARDNKSQIKNDLIENYQELQKIILSSRQSGNRTGTESNVFDRKKRINLSKLENGRTIDPTKPVLNIPKPFGEENNELDDYYKKQVIFSDHHITHKDHRHNYFERWNKHLYMSALRWYSDHGYGLIENGDVEEYTIFEPDPVRAQEYRDTVSRPNGILDDIGVIDWDEIRELRRTKRLEDLGMILNDHSDYYDLIVEKFAKLGRDKYTKITGNHDPYLLSEMVDLLPTDISKNLCDVLKIEENSSEGDNIRKLKYVVTHGHQFDSSTLPQHAFAVGEVYSETLAWAVQGADRVWDNEKTEQWRSSKLLSEFNNILATSHGETDMYYNQRIDVKYGEWLLETLMKNHEIGWDYFDYGKSPTKAFMKEVLTGDEYFKLRHLSETELMESMNNFYSREARRDRDNRDLKDTKIIIGHTHEVRQSSKNGRNSSKFIHNYLNSGSAGRFANFIWGIELIQGTEVIVSWTKDGNKLVRNKWLPHGNGKLIKYDYPLK